MFFYAPSELSQLSINKKIRIGGMVKKGSIIYHDGNKVEFIITDFKQEIKTLYQGILPDLFREGQGVVANGRIKDNVFVADEILAKHDENYMPPVELGNKITPSPL